MTTKRQKRAIRRTRLKASKQHVFRPYPGEEGSYGNTYGIWNADDEAEWLERTHKATNIVTADDILRGALRRSAGGGGGRRKPPR